MGPCVRNIDVFESIILFTGVRLCIVSARVLADFRGPVPATYRQGVDPTPWYRCGSAGKGGGGGGTSQEARCCRRLEPAGGAIN